MESFGDMAIQLDSAPRRVSTKMWKRRGHIPLNPVPKGTGTPDEWSVQAKRIHFYEKYFDNIIVYMVYGI